MIANRFIHRVLLKAACAVLLPLCTAWSVAVALQRPAERAAPPAPELPTHWDGRPLRPLALGAVEQRFARRFPGQLARFAVGPPQGEAAPAGGGTARDAASVGAPVFDGGQVLVLRHALQPTRLLHPAADCYRGLGWRVANERLELDARQRLWRCFDAAQADGRRLRVCERIVDAAGRGFTDTSAWYWAAVLGQSPGPWQAVTVARPL